MAKEKLGPATPIHHESGFSSTTSSPGIHSGSIGSSYMEIKVSLNETFFISVTGPEDNPTAAHEAQALLKIPIARPSTKLGSEQGDHATSFITYLHMLITAAEGKDVREATTFIVEAAKAILPDKTMIFEKITLDLQAITEKAMPRKRRHEMLQYLKNGGAPAEYVMQANNDFKRAKAAIYIDAIRIIAEKFLTEINLHEEITFARIGSRDPAEGGKVKKAIHTLKIINELEGIRGGEDMAEKFDHIYKSYIKTSAPYVIGTNVVFHNTLASFRRHWEAAAKTVSIADKEKIVTTLKNKYNEFMPSSANKPKETLISKCFGDLFDFKYEHHKADDNMPELLCKVAARHIVSIFRAFGEFQNFDEDTKEEIINNFIENSILEEQGWIHYKAITFSKLKDGIMSHIDLNKYTMLSAEQLNHQEAEATNQNLNMGRSK